MSEYGKLMSRIWGDKQFTALSAREQQVFMMLFSFPTRNLAGVVPLTLRRWATCSSDATVENITAALRVLEHWRFLIIDWDTEEVLIRTYIRNDEVWKQPNLMSRCLKYCESVASERLRGAINEELMRLVSNEMLTEVKDASAPAQEKMRNSTLETAKALVKTFADGMQEPLWKPSEEPFPQTFAEPPGDSPTPPPPPTPPPSTGTGTVLAPSENGGAATSKRGTRLPDQWQPPDDVIRSMHEQFPEVDLRHEHDKFGDHWRSKAGKDGVKLDWVATWRNWIRSAAERQGVVGGKRQSASDRAVAEVDAMRDNPRLATNQRLNALFAGNDRKELAE